MTTITKRLEWDSAHRVLRHESKCATLHGHRYAAEITCTGDLDDKGRILDFSVIKERVGKWIDDAWDHTTLLNTQDADLLKLLEFEGLTIPGRRRPYIFNDVNPTAEVIAGELFFKAQELLSDTGVRVVNVRVYETPTSCADYPGLLAVSNYLKEI